MENRSMIGKFKKRDVVFLGILVVVAGIFLLWFLLGYREGGNTVEVTVGEEQYGTYSLNTDQKIPIVVNGVTTNVLVIENGAAEMEEADCPDQICVQHRPASHVGESIVCLPNRVVVTITGEEEPQLDSVVQ